jgi:hypothetical protein
MERGLIVENGDPSELIDVAGGIFSNMMSVEIRK